MPNCHKSNGKNNATDLNEAENGFISLMQNMSYLFYFILG